jgi:hypothetical protein
MKNHFLHYLHFLSHQRVAATVTATPPSPTTTTPPSSMPPSPMAPSTGAVVGRSSRRSGARKGSEDIHRHNFCGVPVPPEGGTGRAPALGVARARFF